MSRTARLELALAQRVDRRRGERREGDREHRHDDAVDGRREDRNLVCAAVDREEALRRGDRAPRGARDPSVARERDLRRESCVTSGLTLEAAIRRNPPYGRTTHHRREHRQRRERDIEPARCRAQLRLDGVNLVRIER